MEEIDHLEGLGVSSTIILKYPKNKLDERVST